MITRRHIRRWLVWAGVGIGVLGVIGYIASIFFRVSFIHGPRRFEIGGGAISVHWVAQKSMPVEQLQRGMDGWLWIPWCDETEHAFNKSWRSGRLVVPYWIFLVVGGVSVYRLLPADYPKGKCRRCGYDLGGVPAENGKITCPECGDQRS